MIKFQELKVGDYVIADNDGDAKRGEVTNLNGDEKQVCVDTGAQGFWYETGQLKPIPITEEELERLKFHKQVNEDGTIKYMKGAFRILISKDHDFSRMEIWYRDEARHIITPISLHNLQNHFYEMTKVHLNDESFD
ncbi:MAG TPA: hypothetical protein VK489_16505 [Ferruginibacter sp.]|nr:hypothetical protein [Ferruginibacter sp.]